MYLFIFGVHYRSQKLLVCEFSYSGINLLLVKSWWVGVGGVDFLRISIPPTIPMYMFTKRIVQLLTSIIGYPCQYDLVVFWIRDH